MRFYDKLIKKYINLSEHVPASGLLEVAAVGLADHRKIIVL